LCYFPHGLNSMYKQPDIVFIRYERQ